MVVGIASYFDKLEGDSFNLEDLYKAIDSAAALYTDNSEAFAKMVADLKAEYRALEAAKAS